MADFVSRLSALQDDFQRRVERVPWVRACWVTTDDRLRGGPHFGRPPSEPSEVILAPEGSISAERHKAYEELYALTDIAADLTGKILRARLYRWVSIVLEPVIEALRPLISDEVWLRFLLFAQPDRFQYRAGDYCVGQDTGLIVYSDGKSRSPDGTNLVFFGQGAVTGWIDNYPRVCVDALARLMAGFRSTSGQKRKPAPPPAGATTRVIPDKRPAKMKAPSVPDRYKLAVKLWPTFELVMQEAKERATIRKFRDWLKKRSNPILLDDYFENWWNNIYRRQLRRSSR